MNKSVLIVGAGERICPAEIIKSFDFVIAADGGYNLIKSIAEPIAVIGDFDSLPARKVPNRIPVLRFPKAKDETDVELALKYALLSAFQWIYITGVSGDRNDHFYVALSLLEKYHSKEIHILTEREDIFILNDKRKYVFENMKNFQVSFFSVTAECGKIKSKGFEYEYRGAVLSRKNPIGVSNFIKEKIAEITFEKGKMLCFLKIR